MSNFAEELAYWYLRLNGFFPLNNFVYHRLPFEERSGRYNADADILALMPPYYYESIFSGKDERQLKSDDWLEEYKNKWIGVIAEVKGSRTAAIEDVERAFSDERMTVAIGRLGLTPKQEIEKIVQEFRNEFCWQKDESNLILIKILFCMDRVSYSIQTSYRWKTITLNLADEFIRQRIREIPDPKSGGRYFFPGALFQYIIWSEYPEHYDE